MSLKELETMSIQEIFDRAAKHLLAQGCKSMHADGRCAYRGIEGRQCAAGIFMSDEEAERNEGLSIAQALRIEGANVDSRRSLPRATREVFLRELQVIHDLYVPANWKVELRQLAEDYDLSTEVLG